MGRIYPIAKSSQLHRIDFSLIPVGVILIEFSALATQLTKDSYTNLADLLLLRGIHTFFMLLLSNIISRYFVAKKIVELKYVTIAVMGTCAIALGALVHSFLGPILGVPLVSPERRIGIILLQGCFWFPAFLIVGSKRTEIFEQFRQYEQRLIISTRARSRTSAEFATICEEIHAKIENQLSTLCTSVRESVALAWNPNADISENNKAIQPHLAGGDLRKLSMDLETFGSEHQGSSFLGQNLNSVNLLITQFRILYSTTARNAPLRRSTYALVLIALVTPA